MKESKRRTTRLGSSLLLLAAALVSVTAVTAAWFSIADRTKVYSIGMRVSTGTALRFDLDSHEELEDYVVTLSFEQIADRVLRDSGYDLRTEPLEPVTTADGRIFVNENTEEIDEESGQYITFTLHFRSRTEAYVHLTSSDGSGSAGTKVSSSNPALAESMRISFRDPYGTRWVYDPGMGDAVEQNGRTRTFGLAEGKAMILSDKNAMFYLPPDEDVPVTVQVWLEGTDEACTDTLRGADWSLQLRFEGTDQNNHSLDVHRQTP